MPKPAASLGDRASPLQLARPEMLLREGQEQIPRFRRLSSLLVEQSLTPREPSGGGTGLAAHEEVEPDPERAAGGARPVARVPVRPVSALERAVELRLASDQVRRGRQPLEVRRAQGALAIGQGQELVGVLPRAAGRTPAGRDPGVSAACHQDELKRAEVKSCAILPRSPIPRFGRHAGRQVARADRRFHLGVFALAVTGLPTRDRDVAGNWTVSGDGR